MTASPVGRGLPHPLAPDHPPRRGITVCHRHDDDWDVYGGRGQNRSVRNAAVGEHGWLGNPYRVNDDGSRAVVIAKYVPVFYSRLAHDDTFRAAIKALDGQRVACYCRHHDDTEPACHLDVIDHFLRRGRHGVNQFLTGLGVTLTDTGDVTTL